MDKMTLLTEISLRTKELFLKTKLIKFKSIFFKNCQRSYLSKLFGGSDEAGHNCFMFN